MDPVSAVGLASAILTFVEFAGNLIGGAVEVYRSVEGTLDENARLGDVQDDLDSLAALLGAQPPCKTRAERRIARVAQDCHADSKTLQNLLREMSGPGKSRAFWQSLKASWMSIKSRKEVAELKARLQEYRSEVLLHVTLLLSEDQSSINLGIAKIRDDCSQLKIEFRTQIGSAQKKVLSAIDDLKKSTSQDQAMSNRCLTDISKMLLAIQTIVEDTQIQHRILRQLAFGEMNSRANQISPAAPDTYSWTVEDGPVNERDERRHAWKVFLEWLRAGDMILHISGNPGSGKSTLMKFLAQHQRTREELQAWAATDTLVFCVFYFWNAGSTMQRTLTGLYRSLLFQALSQCPELTEEVFPAQFRRMQASIGDAMVESIQMFGEDHIEEAFGLLLNRVAKGGYRLCFFIDGLDECEGKRLQHEELSRRLQGWVTSGNTKLCVSSRPYSEFIRPLNIPGKRLIQLHELNESDIRAYCLNRLTNDVDARNRADICRTLAETVVDHAQGVFLWVHLVIDVLIVGFRQGDPDSVLKAQLTALPPDLDTLYAKLREPIETDEIQRDRSNRMLLLAAHNPFDRELTALAFSWLEDEGSGREGLVNPDFPADLKVKYTVEEVSSRLQNTAKQIEGLARGFLEVWEDEIAVVPFTSWKVRFCHKTARDYLLQNEDRRLALLKSFPNFQESQPYARICLLEGFHCADAKGIPTLALFRGLDPSYRQSIDPGFISKFEVSLQQLISPSVVNLPQANRYGDLNSQGSWRRRSSKVSLTAYAAYCGLDSYVLHEVARDTTKLSRTSANGSVLLAAVTGGHSELVSALLSMGQGMNELCITFDHHGSALPSAPACVIAIAHVLEQLLKAVGSRFNQENTKLRMMKELVNFSLDMNISMWATIAGLSSPQGGSFPNFRIDKQVRIGIVDSFRLFETAMGVIQSSTQSRSPGAANTVGKMSNDNNSSAEGQWIDMIQWLSEGFDQSARISVAEGQWRRLGVGKIEWSSDTQELVELTGWTRSC